MEGIDQIITNIEDTIKGMGGNIISTDKMGRKKLAYEVNKAIDGFYLSFLIELEQAKVAELRRYLKLNDNVLREFTTIYTKEKASV